MDFVIVFFRDVLDGPLYYVVATLCSILICSCIGYLGERYLNEKKLRLEHDATHADVSSSNNGTIPQEGVPSPAVAGGVVPQGMINAVPANGQNAVVQVPDNSVQQVVNPPSEEESVDGDPNEHVNYNVTTISSDELLEDD